MATVINWELSVQLILDVLSVKRAEKLQGDCTEGICVNASEIPMRSLENLLTIIV